MPLFYVDNVFGGEGKLAAKPELVAFSDGVWLIMENAKKTIPGMLPHKDPHSLDRDVLGGVIDADAEDELGMTTELKTLSTAPLRYPKCVGCLGVVSLFVLKAPPIDVKVRFAHMTSLARRYASAMGGQSPESAQAFQHPIVDLERLGSNGGLRVSSDREKMTAIGALSALSVGGRKLPGLF